MDHKIILERDQVRILEKMVINESGHPFIFHILWD
jgi:hypothetical protein